jgi:hypothetical protein
MEVWSGTQKERNHLKNLDMDCLSYVVDVVENVDRYGGLVRDPERKKPLEKSRHG